MDFLEKDLEQIIYDAYKTNPKKLKKHGLKINGVLKRQLKIGNYGIADLISIHKEYYTEEYPDFFLDKDINEYAVSKFKELPKLVFTVYELKKDKIGISAYLQAIRYVKGLQEFFSKRRPNNFIEYKIVLIGNKIDDSGSFCFIPSFDRNTEFYIYKYEFNGISFKNQNGYQLINPGF